jgi:2-methylcitrate dehydratase PrpD
MTPIADQLARWAFELSPDGADLRLADRSLLDTLAVTLAARAHPVSRLVASAGPSLGEGAWWAVTGHVLDFDDLHMQSTTHISVVCVPAVLATGGDARPYLAAAGVMARLGNALGWDHYSAGWHATCTAGAPAAAVGAAMAMGLNPTQIATAIALAIPGAGGVQRAFGTDAKSLQVGFAVDTGIRAARLAAAGAHADPSALDGWLRLVGGDPNKLDLSGPAVPGGLAIKIYPACYALQRPISALAALTFGDGRALDPTEVTRIVLRTPEATVAPLIHHRPVTGLQAKFSLEYAAATALLDSYQGFDSFTDSAAQRPEAQRLVDMVEVELDAGGDWLLDGELNVEVHSRVGDIVRASQQYPPGSPQQPPTQAQLRAKLSDCLRVADLLELDPATWTWDTAATVLRTNL